MIGIGCLAAPATALDIRFFYDDPVGTGFLDPVSGSQRQQALANAADIWGRLILSSYAEEVVTVRATFESFDPGSTVLASARPTYFYSEFSSGAPKFDDTNYPKALANHLNGANLSSRTEISIQVNNARTNDFYFGDATPGASQFDFISVATHELAHGLGFYSSFREDGDYGIYGDGTYAPIMLPEMLPTPFDHFIIAGAAGSALLGFSSGARQAAMTSNNLFWSGANAIVGNGGNPVALYAPGTWQAGSSISHLNDSATLMSPSIGRGEVRRTPSAIERGMLRDMGWTLSVFASELSWVGAASGRIADAANWATGIAPLPGDSLVFGAAGTSGTVIDVDLTLYSLGHIRFTPEAPAYTLDFRSGTDTSFTAEGLLNESAQAQTLRLATGAVMRFESAATAANAAFQLAGGDTTVVPITGSYRFDRTAGARITFRDGASALNGSFQVGGGAGNGGIKAQVLFTDTSNADDAVFVNEAGRAGQGEPYNGRPTVQFGFGGETRFEGSASAGRAHITNQGIATYGGQGTGGYTTFAGQSTAANAVIENQGGTGFARSGVTEFVDDATAGHASFTNYSGQDSAGGRTVFFGHSSADHASFVNRATPGAGSSYGDYWGSTVFRGASTAANATIVNEYLGRTEFFDDATAGHATIRLAAAAGSGSLAFNDRASAASADIVSVLGSVAPGFAKTAVIFRGESSAGAATFRVEAGGAAMDVAFNDHSSAGNARFLGGPVGPSNRGQVLFSQSSSAGSAMFTVGPEASVVFSDSSTAADAVLTVSNGFVVAGRSSSLGNAHITVNGYDNPLGGLKTVQVYEGARLGNATVELGGGTTPNARGAELAVENTQRAAGERAGQATIIAHGGQNGGLGATAWITGAISAPGLRLVSEQNALIRFERQQYPSQVQSYEVGSIEGSGRFEITGVDFRTGALGTSTTVSGPISGIVQNLIKVGAGTLSLDGANTYHGPTRVDAGVLAINGSILGDVVVNDGARLEGTGNVGGKVTVDAGGTLAPGLSPGTLHIGLLDMRDGGALQMEIGATQRDMLVVAGDAFLAGVLRLDMWGGYLPQAGDVIVLMEVGGARQGTFSQVLFPTLAPSFQYAFSFTDGRLAMEALNSAQPVPEPGSAWLWFCGGTVFWAWLRRHSFLHRVAGTGRHQHDRSAGVERGKGVTRRPHAVDQVVQAVKEAAEVEMNTRPRHERRAPQAARLCLLQGR